MPEGTGHARDREEEEVAEANRAVSRAEEDRPDTTAPTEAPERAGSAGGWLGRIRRAFALLGRSAD